MTREDLSELHFITPIENIPSILEHGILSHERARAVQHRSVAMAEIQERRKNVMVPGGRRLHEYANLYINARNKMMFKVKQVCGDAALCVLSISTDVLDLPGVVIADQNASSDHARFAAAPDGLRLVDRAQVFATYWTHPGDPIEEMRHGSIVCAEVLVPDPVEPRYIMQAYVSCRDSCRVVEEAAPGLRVSVNPRLFFR